MFSRDFCLILPLKDRNPFVTNNKKILILKHGLLIDNLNDSSAIITLIGRRKTGTAHFESLLPYAINFLL